MGSGEGSSNPLTTPGQLQRQRSPDATDTCRVLVAGVFQMWKGLQMWVALGRELDWRRAAPCRESEPGVSPPRLQHQPAMLPPPSSPQTAPFLSGDFFFFVGRGGGTGRWSTEGKEGAPALGRSPQPAVGLRAPAPPLPQNPYPARPGPADSLEGRSSLISSSVVLSGCPRSQRTLPSPAPPSLRTPLRSRTHRRWGHRLAFRAASGAKPQDEVGGPPRPPRAGFSLWTLRPLASGRSSQPPWETSERREGAGPPRSQDRGRKNLP